MAHERIAEIDYAIMLLELRTTLLIGLILF